MTTTTMMAVIEADNERTTPKW